MARWKDRAHLQDGPTQEWPSPDCSKRGVGATPQRVEGIPALIKMTALIPEETPQVIQGIGEFRPQGNGLAKMVNSLCHLTVGTVGQSNIVMRFGQIGTQGDGTLVTANGLFPSPQLGPDEAEIVHRINKIRLKGDGLPITVNGLGNFIQGVQNAGEGAENFR